ncbi:MAG TPA: anti-sigma factor domain-containing protein [Firmicutes bacterium]|nr:anti-sigma factor domain-containing protein [Bacillota bacterium]HHT42346.1 anti-sigma factor domain-containing protein [Bacillota bacterium]
MRHKGVVVEIAPKGKVIVLTPQGEFIKVPLRKHVQVGQEISFAPRKDRLSALQLAAAAVLFLALLGSWPVVSEYLSSPAAVPAYIITLDLDSSVELVVSSDGKVLSVDGLNRSGKDLAGELDVVGSGLASALKTIASRADLKAGSQQAVVTVASQQDTGTGSIREKRSGTYTGLEQEIVTALRAAQLADVRIWEVPRSLQTEAKLAGIPPSRYMAIQMPASPLIPPKIETRLTMADPPELEETVISQLAGTAVAQRVMEPAKPALTPTRWTREATERTAAGIYNVSFPIAAVKGDY